MNGLVARAGLHSRLHVTRGTLTGRRPAVLLLDDQPLVFTIGDPRTTRPAD